MRIEYDKSNPTATKLMKIYTVQNQDYQRLEKVRKKPLPRLKYKKLYTEE
jgi:hypothetical protein